MDSYGIVRLKIGDYVRSKPGAGQPVIEGQIHRIERDLATIKVVRIGNARVSGRPIFRVRSLSNLKRGEI